MQYVRSFAGVVMQGIVLYCIVCSPDQKLLAVALLDSTVKVFYVLYGIVSHRVVSYCIVCSPDQKLLAVALLDSTVKVFYVLYYIVLYCLQSRPEVVGRCVVGQYGESLLCRHTEGESRVKPSFHSSLFPVLVSWVFCVFTHVLLFMAFLPRKYQNAANFAIDIKMSQILLKLQTPRRAWCEGKPYSNNLCT